MLFPSRSGDQYVFTVIMLLLLLLFSVPYKYLLSRGRAGWKEVALRPAPSPPQLFTPWQKHQPRCVSRGSYEPPGDVWFLPHSLLGTAGSSPSHQPPKRETKVWTGTCSRVPMSQGGHEGPVPGRSWWLPMELALPLQACTFSQGTDGDPQQRPSSDSTWRDLRVMGSRHILSRMQSLKP